MLVFCAPCWEEVSLCSASRLSATIEVPGWYAAWHDMCTPLLYSRSACLPVNGPNPPLQMPRTSVAHLLSQTRRSPHLLGYRCCMNVEEKLMHGLSLLVLQAWPMTEKHLSWSIVGGFWHCIYLDAAKSSKKGLPFLDYRCWEARLWACHVHRFSTSPLMLHLMNEQTDSIQ